MKSLARLDLHDGSTYFLQTEYKEDGKSGFKLTLINGLDVWKGHVSEDDLDNLRLNIKMDLNTFTKQTLQALTKSGGSDIVFNYQVKHKKDNAVELVWKKHVPAEDITFQLGKALLKTFTSPEDAISSVLNYCIDYAKSQQTEISTLQTDNERLSQERVNALKRLEKCVVAKEELETDLYSKFVAILNSKKEKIRDLKQSGVSEPYSRKVCGRGVNLSDVPMCTVLWTSASNSQGNSFVPNHFVPLLKRNTETTSNTITIDFGEVAPNQDNTFCAEPNQDSIFCAEPNQHSIFCSDEIDSNTKDTESASADDDSLSCPFIDTTDDHVAHPLSNGCLDKGFLEVDVLVRVLTTYTYEQSHNSIPDGIKNDVFFVIKNNDNVTSRGKGARTRFSDDCGIWDSSKGSTPKTYFIANHEDGTLKIAYKKKEQFCYGKKVKGKKTFIPLEPQPSPESIIELVRTYSTLKKNSLYKRRVSRLGIGAKNSIAVVEYIGKFPGLAPHGNSKVKTEYIRTPATVMSKMSDLLEREIPLNVYNKLTLKNDELHGPRNRKQVHNKKYNDKKKKCIAENGKPAVNDVDDAKPGPSRIETQSQKRPAKNVDYSDEDHTTDDEQTMKQSKRARKGDNKSLDDDSLVLEEENEDKPTVARPKRSRGANKKTTNSKPVLPKVSSKGSNSSVPEKPSTTSRKSRASSGNTCDNDPNAMIDDL